MLCLAAMVLQRWTTLVPALMRLAIFLKRWHPSLVLSWLPQQQQQYLWSCLPLRVQLQRAGQLAACWLQHWGRQQRQRLAQLAHISPPLVDTHPCPQ